MSQDEWRMWNREICTHVFSLVMTGNNLHEKKNAVEIDNVCSDTDQFKVRSSWLRSAKLDDIYRAFILNRKLGQVILELQRKFFDEKNFVTF